MFVIMIVQSSNGVDRTHTHSHPIWLTSIRECMVAHMGSHHHHHSPIHLFTHSFIYLWADIHTPMLWTDWVKLVPTFGLRYSYF